MSVRRRPGRWNLPPCLRVELLRMPIFLVRLTSYGSNLDNHSWDRVRSCEIRRYHWRSLNPGKYARETCRPRHVQLLFSQTHTLANWTDQGRSIKVTIVTVAAGRSLYSGQCWLVKGFMDSVVMNAWTLSTYLAWLLLALKSDNGGKIGGKFVNPMNS